MDINTGRLLEKAVQFGGWTIEQTRKPLEVIDMYTSSTTIVFL